MLKKFFLNLLSSFMGAWIAIVLLGIVVVVIAVGFFSQLALSGTKTEQVTKHSVLVLNLEGVIEEAEVARQIDVMQLMQGNVEVPQTLNILVQALEDGAQNKNIDALLIKCNGVVASPATLHALREAVVKFKENANGKQVLAYGPSMAQADYYVASAADSIFLNPQGNVAISGISGTMPYFKGLADKLGVQFQVAKVGTFKSAVEPYTTEHMSEPARAQLDTLYNVMWDFMTAEMAKSRNIQAPLFSALADSVAIFSTAEQALQNKLVDKIAHYRHVEQSLARITGKEANELNYVSPQLLASQSNWNNLYNAKQQVAVLYATGEISEENNYGINCEELCPVINELADDDNVKGLVLRVNSPGGSVFGSAEIAEALQYFKSKGKPFAVSMGDYAASGGYWISADADVIFADPLTITGSIGIFGLFPNCQQLLTNLGVNIESVGNHPNGTLVLPLKPLNEAQMAAAQKYINRGYDQFVSRVAKGRKMSDAKVRTIAEGRVWNAMTAQKIGLVDSLGNLAKAVDWVKSKAGDADNLAVTYYPKYEPGIWDLISQSQMQSTIKTVKAIKAQTRGRLSDSEVADLFMLLSRRDALALMPKIYFQ